MILDIPPAILHDLRRGTFSNVEQQSLNFFRSLGAPVKQFEMQLNLKILGRYSSGYIDVDTEYLLRTDLKSRAEALRVMIFGAIITPNEARERLNLPPLDGGDELYMQGATVPLADIEALANGEKPQPEPKE